MKLAKKLSVIFMAAALAAAPVAGTFVEPTAIVEAKEASISAADLDLFVGTNATLKVSGAKKVKWASSDATVAKVSKKGVVTGMKAGTATITAKAGKNELTCVVYVYDLRLTLNKTTLEMTESNQEELIASVTVPGRPIVWTTSDEAVATVDNGVVTAVAPGTATITATLTSNVSAACAVTVKAGADFGYKERDFYLERPGYFGYEGKLDKEASYYLDGVLQTGQLWVNDDGSWSSMDYNENIEDGDHVLKIVKEGYKPFIIEFKYETPVIEGLIADDYHFYNGNAYVIGLNFSLEGKTVSVSIDGGAAQQVTAFMNGDGYVVAYVEVVNPTPGKHSVTVSAEGFDSQTVEIEV